VAAFPAGRAHCVRSLAGVTLALLGPALGASDARAQAAGTPDLTDLSLEELADVKVTGVSKKGDDLSTLAAAVHVLTQEDIRRSGATTLPELLRSVPGVEVARIDASHWSVGVRGFGDQFSKSVLVLVDGRNVYTPLFAGVFWAVQDVPLADIERIEVIRGPGGTVWGANAVNGVINVITYAASATRGTRASITAGNVDEVIAELRHGGGNGRGFDYRLYGKTFSRAHQFHEGGADFDDWSAVRVGGRADWVAGDRTLTVQGDLHSSDVGQRVALSFFAPPRSVYVAEALQASGGNVMARLAQKTPHGGWALDGYYDRASFSGPNVKEVRDTFDLDFVHHRTLPGRQELVFGAGARFSPSTVTQVVPTLDFQPRDRSADIYSAFVQDEVQVLRDRLFLTIGAKVEHHGYTGVEAQPSARVTYRLGPRQAVWAAATRAVRTPSRLERDVRWDILASAEPPAFVRLEGNPAFGSERLNGFEAGYRALLGPRLFVDLAAFHNEYRDLQGFGEPSFTVDAEPAPAHLTLHVPYANAVEGSTHGFEVAVDARPVPRWQLNAEYSFLGFSLRSSPGAADTLDVVAAYEGSSPRHNVSLQSRIDLPGGVELDQTYRYVSALPHQAIDGYHSLDLRAARRLGAALELSVVGKDLLQPRHAELEHSHDPRVVVQIRRSAYVQLTWKR
jgi:iron complex outermembrane receptor protein